MTIKHKTKTDKIDEKFELNDKQFKGPKFFLLKPQLIRRSALTFILYRCLNDYYHESKKDKIELKFELIAKQLVNKTTKFRSIIRKFKCQNKRLNIKVYSTIRSHFDFVLMFN